MSADCGVKCEDAHINIPTKILVFNNDIMAGPTRYKVILSTPAVLLFRLQLTGFVKASWSPPPRSIAPISV